MRKVIIILGENNFAQLLRALIVNGNYNKLTIMNFCIAAINHEYIDINKVKYL